MIDLKDKINEIIERETKKGHFFIITTKNATDLIQLLLENYEKTNNLKQDFSNLPKKGELIFLAAPTGAGKDSLVIKLCSQNPEKNYIELNMDMFRHYFPLFIPKDEPISDKTFANQTNQFSYEIFLVIQEIILTEFPGTNIIITGTLREIDWPQRIMENYKSNKNTKYKITLASLAVPKQDSSFSIIKRYAQIIADQSKRRDFQEGTARYTSKEYHDETYDRFPSNLKYFENMFRQNPGELIDEFKVYRRSRAILDFKDDNLVYSSSRIQDSNKTAFMSILELRQKNFFIPVSDVIEVLKVVKLHSDYLNKQDTLRDVLNNLETIVGNETINKFDIK